MKGSERLNSLAESETLAITKRVRALKAEGRDVVGLTLGEPDFNTPEHIREAAIQAIREGFTHYPPVAGIPELREAVAAKYRQRYGMEVGPANVMVSTGAKQSLLNAIMCLVNPHEEVIVSAPYWVSYREMLKMARASVQVVLTSLETEFKASAADIEARITPKTRMLILNSPSNPTGSMYTQEELAGICEMLERHPQVYILTDEIYEHLVYEGEMVSLAQFPQLHERTIFVNGVSKAFAMTGWRIGYVVAPAWIVNLCDKYQGQITSGACSISQRAAHAALTGPMEPSQAMVEEFRRRRDWMYAQLREIPGLESHLPHGAFYFYPDLSAFFGRKTPAGQVLQNIDELCDYLLMDGLLAVIPGTAFGTAEHVRISYAYSMDALRVAVERLQNALHALQ